MNDEVDLPLEGESKSIYPPTILSQPRRGPPPLHQRPYYNTNNSNTNHSNNGNDYPPITGHVQEEQKQEQTRIFHESKGQPNNNTNMDNQHRLQRLNTLRRRLKSQQQQQQQQQEHELINSSINNSTRSPPNPGANVPRNMDCDFKSEAKEKEESKEVEYHQKSNTDHATNAKFVRNHQEEEGRRKDHLDPLLSHNTNKNILLRQQQQQQQQQQHMPNIENNTSTTSTIVGSSSSNNNHNLIGTSEFITAYHTSNSDNREKEDQQQRQQQEQQQTRHNGHDDRIHEYSDKLTNIRTSPPTKKKTNHDDSTTKKKQRSFKSPVVPPILRNIADDIPEIHFLGELNKGINLQTLSSSSSSSSSSISCKWKIDWGKSFSLLEGMDSGQTQYALNSHDDDIISHGISPSSSSWCCRSGCYRWNHPFDVHFTTTSMKGWPRIIVELWELDGYGRTSLIGFGFTYFPCMSGTFYKD